jgi:hypothetical protein
MRAGSSAALVSMASAAITAAAVSGRPGSSRAWLTKPRRYAQMSTARASVTRASSATHARVSAPVRRLVCPSYLLLPPPPPPPSTLLPRRRERAALQWQRHVRLCDGRVQLQLRLRRHQLLGGERCPCRCRRAATGVQPRSGRNGASSTATATASASTASASASRAGRARTAGRSTFRVRRAARGPACAPLLRQAANVRAARRLQHDLAAAWGDLLRQRIGHGGGGRGRCGHLPSAGHGITGAQPGRASHASCATRDAHACMNARVCTHTQGDVAVDLAPIGVSA